MARRPVPQGRRLTAKGRQTKDRIVVAAANLMARHGAAGTSIDAIRHAAAVSGSQIAHYFPTKLSLTRAVIAWQTDLALELLPGRRGMTSLAEIESWAAMLIRQCDDDRAPNVYLLGRLAGELADADGDLRADLATSFHRRLACLAQGLRGMQEHGEIRPDTDPDELAAALLSTVEGGMLLARASQDITLLEAPLSVVLDHLRSLMT